MVDLLEELADAVGTGKPNTIDLVKDLVEKGLKKRIEAKVLLDKGLIAGMEIVNWRFKNNLMYIPEVLIAGRAMKEGMKILGPKFSGTNTKRAGKILIGTVEKDLHDIGKNLVIIMLKGKGFEVIDLGVDVAPETFVEEAKKEEEDLRFIGMSALLTTTMPAMEKTIDALDKAKITTRVMVGGAPVTESYATQIGADEYAPDAASAANIAVELLDSELSA